MRAARRSAGWALLAGLLLGSLAPGVAQAQLDPQFSAERGFYDAPFSVEITSGDPAAAIRYSLDGTPPSASSGTVYSGPIPVSTTTVIQAVAYTGSETSVVETHTYLFLDDVLQQPASIPGWPRRNYDIGGGDDTAQHDYEMDPEIVGSPEYGGLMRDAMTAIPTMSLVMDQDDFWAVNDEEDAELPASVEMLYPDDPARNEQTTCGVEGHSTIRLKRSFRLEFKSEYGDGKWDTDLFRTAPLNGETAVDRFDRIVLRAGNNRSWSRNWNPDRTAFTRDQWYRDTQISMSGIGSHGLFVHLYINGLYWGLYNPSERPDHWFTSAYYGGDETDWFAVGAGYSQGGRGRFRYLTQTLVEQDMSDPARYAELQEYLDVEEFSDYLALTWFMGMVDWPHTNYWGGMRNVPAGPLEYYAWDGEWSWDDRHGGSRGAWVHPEFRSDATPAEIRTDLSRLWHAARQSPEFLLTFADRVFEHIHHDGALTDDASRDRWAILNDAVRVAVIGESARWGDAVSGPGGAPRTRVDWQAEVDRVGAMMVGNADRLVAALRAEGYYPSNDPPAFSAESGPVSSGFELSMSNPNTDGTILLTVDGRDPRAPGGDVAATAAPYAGPVPINGTTTVKARVLSGMTWSALHQATFVGEQDLGGLVINELMYHPPDAGPVLGTELEFLELVNAGASGLDLSGLAFTQGITYTFPEGTSLAAGDFLVLASNAAAFQAHTGIAAAGEYDGQLSNGGELIELRDLLGFVVDAVEYDDAAPWAEAPDGDGPSLSLTRPDLDNALAASWGASADDGGTPGAANGVTPEPTARFTATPASGPAPLVVAFDAGASSDDVGIVSYSWDFGDGSPTASGVTANHVYAAGDYTATLTVTDGDGLSDDATAAISAAPGDACSPAPPMLVLNEIQYKALSGETTDSDDWVEIVNPTGSAVDLDGWVFKDDDDDHVFALPAGTTLAAGGYLVLAKDPAAFAAVHPDVTGVVGPFDFGLGGSGDTPRLFSPSACLVDVVAYLSEAPWPSAPDGTGPTLALVHPSLDNALAEHWRASTQVGGTPGAANGMGPAASFSATPESGPAPLTVQFDASASASDAGITAYVWDFGDGSPAGSGVTAEHVYAAGDYTATLTITDGDGATAQATTAVSATADGDGPFLEADGQVVFEAEHVVETLDRDGQSWQESSAPAGASGTALCAGPDRGVRNSRAGYSDISPQFDVEVDFGTTGRYIVWARVWAPDGDGGSFHAGLDGVEVRKGKYFDQSLHGEWAWTHVNPGGSARSLPVDAPGVRRVNVWMREDGLCIDKLVLTTDDTFEATGLGPAESPRGGAALALAKNGLGADEVPDAFALGESYPNPFSRSATIPYDLPEEARVRLVVYDALGREVVRLVDADVEAGRHRARFDASQLPSGVYLYRITAGSFGDTGRMVLLR